jgi:tRNA-specific 2-thiouridylase
MTSNIVYVSRTYYEQERRRDAFVCGPFNWLGSARPAAERPLFVKVRHGPNMYECSLQLSSKAAAAAVLEQGTQQTFQPLAAGQSTSSSSGGGSSIGGGSSSSTEVAQQYGVVLLSHNDQGLASGQYAVFYQDQECLGSAQIIGGLARSVATTSA